jgi:hypothetical protein
MSIFLRRTITDAKEISTFYWEDYIIDAKEISTILLEELSLTLKKYRHFIGRAITDANAIIWCSGLQDTFVKNRV